MLVKQYFVFVFFRAPEPSAFDFDDTASEASSKVQMTPRTPGQYSTASRVLTQFCLAQLCENGGGRPRLPSLINLWILLDVKQCFNQLCCIFYSACRAITFVVRKRILEDVFQSAQAVDFHRVHYF